MKNNLNTLAEEMFANLISSRPKINDKVSKVAMASQHLNNASDLLEDLGLESQSNLIKNIISTVNKK